MSETTYEENLTAAGSCIDTQDNPEMSGECSKAKCNEVEDAPETPTEPCCSSKFEIVTYDTDNSSCSSCSTRRNSFCSVTSDSELEATLTNLFHTPSTTSASSHLSTPGTADQQRRSATPILDGVDILLQRLTNERFAELRNIQLSERPVTGGGARDNIATFMRRAVHGPTEEEQRLEELANRPEHVETEVQYLQQRSVVQTSLTNDFRSILERTLLARMSSPRQPTVVRSNTQPERDLVGGNSFRSRLEALFGERASSDTLSGPAVNNAPRQRRRSITRPNNAPVAPAPPQQHVPTQEQTQGSFTIESGMQLLAESIADDLDRLQSLHVVSGMLRGDFRREMETLVQSRIQDENNAEETAQYIRSLPGRRPDTHPAQNHHRHAHAPINATMQSQTAINAGVSAELSSLARQLEEMKRMLTMSMEIQMDTQRAVRQEVSGIFNTFAQTYLGSNAVQTPAPQPPTMHQTVSTPVNAGQCVICLDRNVDAVLYQCGHMCTCNQCGMQLKMNGHNCPMCRAPIRDVIRAYQTQS